MNSKPRLSREAIAMRAAKELEDGACVNLGIGIPTLVSSCIPEAKTILFHSETGLIGFGRALTVDETDAMDYNLINASGQFVVSLPGMCILDHATTFTVVRGGRLDVTILGALQVSEKGDLANWTTSQDLRRGGIALGGAMDMPVGAKRVIVTIQHTTKQGEPKIVKKCTYPLTGSKCVHLIITDLAVIEVTSEGLLLREVAPSWTIEEVQALTEPRLIVGKDIGQIEL